MNRVRERIAVGLLAVLAGCAPAHVEGVYSVTTTNGANGCGLSNWTVGGVGHGIEFAITQDGSTVTGTVGGIVSFELDMLLGSHVFTGSVMGSRVDMALHGTQSITTNGCAHTYDARLEGELRGNVLAGTITYRVSSDGEGACAPLAHCETVETFDASR